VNVVGELQRKRTLAASRGFLAAARLSCFLRIGTNRARYNFHSVPISRLQYSAYHMPYKHTSDDSLILAVSLSVLCWPENRSNGIWSRKFHDVL